MTFTSLALRASSLAIAANIAVASPAMAQSADIASDAADSGEIVVTAQKRSESVQAVPISIAAFSGASLDKASVVTVLDLGKIATNFQSVRSSNTGSTRIGIRGVGSLANTLIEPSVAVTDAARYVAWTDSRNGNDEIYVARLSAAGVWVLLDFHQDVFEGMPTWATTPAAARMMRGSTR